MLQIILHIILLTQIETKPAVINPPLPIQKIEKLLLSKEKILTFVKKNKSQFRIPDLILLDFIKRRFNLPEDFSFEKSYSRQSSPTPEDIAYLRTYGRMVEYKGIEYKKPEKAEPFIWNEIHAIFINKPEDCPDKNEILKRLENQLKNGKGYEITHTALALGLFIERKCLNPNDPTVETFTQKICASLLHISRSIPTPTDLKLECLCFLCYLNHKEMVSITDVEKLSEYQRPDGAFSGNSNPNSGINVHSTLLALWLLCEFTSTSVSPQATMIRNP